MERMMGLPNLAGRTVLYSVPSIGLAVFGRVRYLSGKAGLAAVSGATVLLALFGLFSKLEELSGALIVSKRS